MRNWFISSLGKKAIPSPVEDIIRNILNGYSIEFHIEVSFKALKYNNGQYPRFDFYIPSINTIIEYDGKKYHKTIEQKKNDMFKTNYCNKNGIKIVRYNIKHYKDLAVILHKLVTTTKKIVTQKEIITKTLPLTTKKQKQKIQQSRTALDTKKKEPLGMVYPKGMSEAEYRKHKFELSLLQR